MPLCDELPSVSVKVLVELLFQDLTVPTVLRGVADMTCMYADEGVGI
jgi:hypothetical protein